jgi:peptidoglycan/LPS O-acetylase OafA/YrhL
MAFAAGAFAESNTEPNLDRARLSVRMAREMFDRRAQLLAPTGLRFIAAAVVVAFHFVRWRFDSRGFLRHFMSCGFIAVGLFFVLSGFILVHAYEHISLSDASARRQFWRARFARVYPVYALGMLSGACVTFLIGWNRLGEFQSLGGALRLAAVVTMLTGVSHRTMFLFNWAAWSLTAELVFYILFPLVIEPLRRADFRKIILGTIALSLVTWTIPAIYLQLDPDHLGRPLRLGDELVTIGHYLKFFPLMHVHEFLWGITAGICWQRFRASFSGISSLARNLVIAVSALVVSAIAMLGLDRFYVFLHSGLFAPLFALLIVSLASGPSFVARVLSMRPIVILGEASYVTYMIHVPLYLAMEHELEHRMSADARCETYLGVLCVLSLVIHYAYEKPLRNLIAKRKLVAPLQPMT